jgi:hypothetical protein
MEAIGSPEYWSSIRAKLNSLAEDQTPTFAGLNLTGPITSTVADGLRRLILGNNTTGYSPQAGETGLEVHGNQLYFFNNGGALQMVGAGSGGASPTIQADDPTEASATGWYLATTSGDAFYKSDDGLFNISAGTYVADTPATYSLTLTVADSGTLTINGTGYTSSGSPHTITGLSGSVSITAAYGGTNNTLSWTGTDAGDVSGSYPNYSITMDSAKAITATFSESGGGSGSLTAFIAGSENNGATLSTGTGTLTVSGMTHAVDHNSVTDGAFLNSSGYAEIPTSGNIDYAVGKISFWIYPTATQTANQYRYMFSDAADYHAFCLVHEADNTLRLRTTSGSAYFPAAVSTNLLTQNTWHFVELTWSDVDDQVTLRINGGTVNTQSLSFTGATESTNFRLFNSSAGGSSGYQARFDTVSIYSTTSGE